MRAVPPTCQMCGSKEGSVLFLDAWVLCPECWATANAERRAVEEAMDALEELASDR